MPDFPDRGSFTYDRVSGTGAYAELKKWIYACSLANWAQRHALYGSVALQDCVLTGVA